MAQPRTARIGLGFIWGILGFCLLGLLVAIFRGGPTPGDAYEDQRAAERTKRLAELREEAHAKLTKYAVDKEKKTAQIPIERAMELTLKDLVAKGISPSAEKAEIVPSLLVPPYLKPAVATEAAPQEAAPAASAAPIPAAAEPTPASQPSPAAEPQTPATPAAPSEN